MLPTSNFLPGKRVKTKERTVKENSGTKEYPATFNSYDKRAFSVLLFLPCFNFQQLNETVLIIFFKLVTERCVR